MHPLLSLSLRDGLGPLGPTRGKDISCDLGAPRLQLYRSDVALPSPRKKTLPKSFFKMVDELNLKDIWRERNGKTQQYTFYSNRHLSWSRIDMIWISTELISNIQ
uniref:Uncharacterized protein n=1 Tax=Pseudonaja textilis TaxID=8673 RepID=A0A670ZE42_PSETE